MKLCFNERGNGEAELPKPLVPKRSLGTRLNWQRTKPVGEGDYEVRQAANFFAREAYRTAGCKAIRWVYHEGDPQECRALGGKTVAIDEPFVAEPLGTIRRGPVTATAALWGRREVRHIMRRAFRGETRVNPNHDAKGLFAAADSGGSTGGVAAPANQAFPMPTPPDGVRAGGPHPEHRAVEGRWPQKYRLVDRPEAERLKKETGLDLSGCVHSAGKSEINHILSGHGEGNEWREGQSPITEDDLAMVPEESSLTPIQPSFWNGNPRIGTSKFVIKSGSTGTYLRSKRCRVGGRAGGQLALKSMHKVATSAAGAGTT